MRADLGDCVAIVALKLATCGLVLGLGFHAVSDDDFARVVIAQQWVAAPSWDPSGTSWLPFPFWLDGAVMAVLGRSFLVARVVALLSAAASALLVYAAARWLEVERVGALVGALLACCIPYACWLGAATVPDGYTAALILFGAVAMRREAAGQRLLGAAALTAATLSRYEAWPVAATFALLAALDGWRARNGRLVAVGGAALAGPLLWVAMGAAHHGDPLFFVTRVSAYRAAIGGTAPSLVAALLGYPLAVLRCEPELAALALGTLGVALAARQPLELARYSRLALGLGALIAFLLVGAVRNAAPTHHAERALLSVWLATAIWTGDLGTRTWLALGNRHRLGGLVALGALIGVSAGCLRPWYARRDDFADRRAELAIGTACHARATSSDRLVIDTPDYGFFAVMAGFRNVERAAPLDDRDPRRSHGADPFRDPAALAARLAGERASWLVTSGAHRAVARQVAYPEVEQGELLLLRVGGPAGGQ